MALAKYGTTRGGKGLIVKRRFITRSMTTATALATLPRGSVILNLMLAGTASNAGTTATISVGTSKASANEFVNGQSVLAGGLGNGVNNLLTTGAIATGIGKTVGNQTVQTDTKIWAKYAETGTASTVGDWVLYIMYTTGNDTDDDAKEQ